MTISRELVEGVAREVIGDSRACLLDLSVEELGSGVSSAIDSPKQIRRIHGTAISRSRLVAWSCVMKTHRHRRVGFGDHRHGQDDPRAYDNWQREAHAYASGLLHDVGTGLVAPRCYRIDEEPGAGVTLWLEDIPDAGASAWPLGRYADAARDLGRFNGRHLWNHEGKSLPWLSRGRVRDWLTLAEPGIAAMPEGRRAGFLGTWLTDDTVTRLERLWAQRDRLITALEGLPQSLCHHDAHRRNLGSRRWAGQDHTVAIDWEMFGTGHLGEDVAAMMAGSLRLLDVPMAHASELEAAILDGFTMGLRDAGWSGHAEDVRLGYLIAASLSIGVGGAGIWFGSLSLEGLEAEVERIIGRSRDEIASQWARLEPFLLDLGDEALRLVS